MTPGPSITEGIGNSRVTENLAGTEIDDSVQVTDQEMVDMCYTLLRQMVGSLAPVQALTRRR